MKEPIEIFTSLDLEMNQPSGKIIQVGACIGNVSTGKILDKLSLYVNPMENLRQDIVELTGITQFNVDSGLSVEGAYVKLKEMHEMYDSFVNCITWGGGDSKELLEQLRLENTDIEWCFGRRWLDTKTLFVSWRVANKKPIQGGLAKSMLKVGLRFQGRKHNACDDAVNTFHMYCRMLSMIRGEYKNEQDIQKS